MIHANVFGVLYCTHAALPLMIEQGSGHIVNVSSVAGRFARAGSGVYNLTKFGVGAFSEALRQEVAALGHPRDARRARAPWPPSCPGHNRPEIQEMIRSVVDDASRCDAEDIADGDPLCDRLAAERRGQRVLVRPAGQVR